MQRNFRLTRSTDFKRVRLNGKSYAHPLIVLIALPKPPDPASASVQVGVTAGRSVGNAVVRNRAKRLMRAALQPYLTALLPGWDLILIARRPMASASFQKTQETLLALLSRARLLQSKHDD